HHETLVHGDVSEPPGEVQRDVPDILRGWTCRADSDGGCGNERAGRGHRGPASRQAAEEHRDAVGRGAGADRDGAHLRELYDPPHLAPLADVLAVAFEPYAVQCPYLFKPGGLRYSRSSFVDSRHTTVMEDYRWG